MLMKAGLIISVFMHLMWERLAMIYALAIPLFAVMVFIALMSYESDYTFLTRGSFFGP
jgi:cytochrome c oxidase subunit IV